MRAANSWLLAIAMAGTKVALEKAAAPRQKGYHVGDDVGKGEGKAPGT